MTGRSRLLVVSNFFDTHRGGLEIVAGRLARELAARGFDVRWIASNETVPPAIDPKAPVQPIGVEAFNITERRLGVPYPLLGPTGLRRLSREIAACDAVMLHDSLYMISVAAFLLARRHGKPLLVVQHIGAVPYRNAVLRGLMTLANRSVARPLLAQAQQVVFISEMVRGVFGDVAFARSPLLIFNGVDTEVFKPSQPGEKAAARARFDLAADRPVALFVGRFVEKKGLHVLRRVAAARPDIDWIFAGWGLIDPASWGLPNVRVISDASGADLAQLYRASDVFVLPSQGEGFPLVVQEALACGLPVICGTECPAADAEAAPFLTSVDVTGDADTVAQTVVGKVDAALAAPDRAAPARRFEFVRRRYAWTAAAERYAGALDELAGASVRLPAEATGRVINRRDAATSG